MKSKLREKLASGFWGGRSEQKWSNELPANVELIELYQNLCLSMREVVCTKRNL